VLKYRHLEIGIAGLSSLLAAAVAWWSASAWDQATMIVTCIVAGFVVIFGSSLLIGWRREAGAGLFSGAVVWTFVALGIICSVGATQWPLRITFARSRAALDALAERVRARDEPSLPRRAGHFTIRRAFLADRDIVCLWTDPMPGRNTGFVQGRPIDIPFSVWTMVRFDDRWQFITQE
jgi:hypothetical protein